MVSYTQDSYNILRIFDECVHSFEVNHKKYTYEIVLCDLSEFIFWCKLSDSFGGGSGPETRDKAEPVYSSYMNESGHYWSADVSTFIMSQCHL